MAIVAEEPMVAGPVGRLENGAVMGRDEFHRLFSECETLERVELIEGVVYMPSPVMVQGHAREQTLMIEWLRSYTLPRPELEAISPASVLLDDENEPIPDAMLYRLREGRFEGGYLLGAPELIVEIANTSSSRDLHQKKRAYERNGVKEYIVWRTRDGVIDWFELRDGRYVQLQPGADGIIASREFPGLRLDVAAMLRLDRKAVLAALR